MIAKIKTRSSVAALFTGAGEKSSVPANSRFEIRTTEGYRYICHFG